MKKIIIFFVFFSLSIVVSAQQDTNYYKEYNDKLIISLYNSFARQNDISFSQKITKDTSAKSTFHYYADADVISGIEFDYDIFSLAFAYKAVPPQNAFRKGKTYYSDIGLNLSGKKWKLETSYKNYKGFYDINSSNYIPSFSDSTPYYQNHNMRTQNLKAKFIYIKNNKRFSYNAAYDCYAQQIKSAFSWIFVGNLYYNSMSADTSFIPFPIRKYYSDYSSFNGLNVIGLSAGAGFSANLVVFHKFFGNITMAIEPESQWRKYSYSSCAEPYKNYITAAADSRISFGYNGKKFFFFASFIADYSNYNSGAMTIANKLFSGATTIGYRFRITKPKFYKRFEETKIYKLL